MNDTITLVSEIFGLKGAVFVLVLLLINLVCTGILQLREAWNSIFSMRTKYINEKQRLELTKLYYEIEAIKKEHGLESIQLATAKREIDPTDYLANEVPIIDLLHKCAIIGTWNTKQSDN